MSCRTKDEANHDLQIADILPLAALDERVAVFGASGAGKTYAAKSWVERSLEAGARVCVVDPLRVWWGLRASADENLAEVAIGAQLDAVLDLRDHVDDLAAAELPKGFGR
jgi:DNA helicase HerA-like ATPase